MDDEPFKSYNESRCKIAVCSCLPVLPGMSHRKPERSVSFDDNTDSPTFPRWRAYSSTSVHGSTESETLLSDAGGKGSKTTVQATKKRTRLDYMSFQNTVHLAALSGDEKEVKRLLSKGANVNKFDRHGKTPLHNAILSRITSVVQVVLLAGADVTLPDHHGDTPLHIAVGVGSADVVKLLLQCTGCQVNSIGQNGLTPLHVAAQLNNVEITMMLVSQGAKITDKAGYFLTPFALAISKGSYETAKYFASILNSSIASEMTDVDGENSNALHLAVSSGNLQVVKLCLKNGASATTKRNEDEATPLHIACSRGYLDIVKALVEQDPGILRTELVDNQGMTPLHRAAVGNHPEVIKYLIDKNCPVDPRDINCHTPLLLASASGCTASVQVLLEKGADVVLKDSNLNSCLHAAVGNLLTLEALLKSPDSAIQIAEKDVNGLTPLHYAVQQGDFKCTKLLLSFNPSAIEIVTDEYNETALHLAACNGFADIVQLMTENRNERVLNAKNKQKRTALHLACIEGNETVVEILAPETEMDGDINYQTPLHCAARNGSLKSVQLILQAHPKRLNDMDKNKNTALNIAGICGHAHIVEFLLSIDGLAITCNMNDMNVLDLAIDNQCESVALVIAENERWRETLHPTPMGDNSQLDILVQTLPNVAEVFLDRCIEKEGNSSDINYKITYDLRLIQGMSLPGPTVKGYSLKFLKTMAAYRREGCLGHPVCYALMSLKWRKFGWITFIANLFVYTAFLLSMTILVFKMKNICGKAIESTNNTAELLNKWWECTHQREFRELVLTQYFVIALVLLLIAKEFAELFKRKKKYFQDVTNALEWIIYGTALFYILPVCACKRSAQVEAAALCLFCAWINLALHMRRSSTYGRYVLMVLTMVKTVIEVAMLFSLFVVAFGMAFFILLDTTRPIFKTVQKSIAKTFVMTLGELTFDQTFLNNEPEIDHKIMNYIIFVSFCFLMPIILMNMLIGLAVGDIDNIQQNAVIQRYIMQVEHLIELEESLPIWVLRRLRIKQHVEYPNRPKTLLNKLWNMFCSLGTAKDNSNDYHHRIPKMLTQLKGKIVDNEERIKELGQAIMQQTQLLRDINRRLAGNTESTGTRIMNWFSSGLGDWRSFKLY